MLFIPLLILLLLMEEGAKKALKRVKKHKKSIKSLASSEATIRLAEFAVGPLPHLRQKKRARRDASGNVVISPKFKRKLKKVKQKKIKKKKERDVYDAIAVEEPELPEDIKNLSLEEVRKGVDEAMKLVEDSPGEGHLFEEMASKGEFKQTWAEAASEALSKLKKTKAVEEAPVVEKDELKALADKAKRLMASDNPLDRAAGAELAQSVTMKLSQQSMYELRQKRDQPEDEQIIESVVHEEAPFEGEDLEEQIAYDLSQMPEEDQKLLLEGLRKKAALRAEKPKRRRKGR